MSACSKIESVLKENLDPSHLEVINESFMDAMKRELYEEVGIEENKIKFIGEIEILFKFLGLA